MKNLIIIIFIFIRTLLFSQEIVNKNELSFVYINNRINIDEDYFTVNNNNLFSNNFGFVYKYYIKNRYFSIGIDFYKEIKIGDNKEDMHVSKQINIPFGQSFYFFNNERLINPNIGIYVNNNFVFSENLSFSYFNEQNNYTEKEHYNSSDLRYQMALTINAGVSVKIINKLRLNINVFSDIINSYELNPKGTETLSYKMYGYNFGIGYKF